MRRSEMRKATPREIVMGAGVRKEAVVLRSPFAYNPMQILTEAERQERYRERLDDTVQPHTVVDVLTGVFHHCFADDLKDYVSRRPGEFVELEEDRRVSRVWVNECQIRRVETLYFQPINDFQVDLYVQTAVRLETVRGDDARTKKAQTIRRYVRMRYCFDLRPCKSICRFEKVVVNEAESLLAMEPGAIRADKYLLPILKEEDYPYLAEWIRDENDLSVNPLDVKELIKRLGITPLRGYFPESDVMGEIYFSFGHAAVMDADTGEIRETDINPGTIVVNTAACTSRGMYNVTLLHEYAHLLLARKHFLLQRMHGQPVCSYLCRRRRETVRRERLSPVDIMEIQANKLPGYLLIDDESGKAKAEEMLASYQDRSVVGMQRLLRDMAEHYGATQTMTRTRLLAMGFQEMRGILQSANGELVPSYVSDLKDGQTYMISHSDALREYVRNAKFRSILDSGRYVYCEGHFCLNDARYIRVDRKGCRHLSMYARNHMFECCLVFEEVYDPARRRLINGVLQKGRGGTKHIRYVDQDGGSPVTEEGRAFQKMIASRYQEGNQFRVSFNDMLVKLMAKRKISIGQLAEASGLSNETISNMRNDSRRQFSVEPIVAICIAMHLPPEVSHQLIESSPAKFSDTEEMSAYRYALDNCNTWSVGKVNRLLVEAGYRPLTDLVDGYGEDGVRLAN